MTTELIGQSQTIEATVQADGDARPRGQTTTLAHAIRVSAMRVSSRAVGDQAARWIEGFLRLEQPNAQFDLMHPVALDSAVRRAITAMDAVSIAECEQVAQRFCR